ncbi:hypothetical protein D3C86_1497110 [compost metagenome]
MHTNPLPKCRGAFSDINRHIKHFTSNTAHQLTLGVRGQLIMQPTQHTFAGFGVIVLNESDTTANGCFKLFLVEAFKEESAFIAKDFGFNDFYVGDVGVDDVHVVLGNRDWGLELGNYLFTIPHLLLTDHLQQISPIGIFSQWCRQILHLLCADKALAVSDLFRAGDFQALAMLDGLNEVTCFNHAFMGSSIQPSITTAHHGHRQIALLQIDTVHIGDF